MKGKIKSLLKFSIFLKAIAFIVDDLLKGIQISIGKIDSNSGTIHSRYSVEESVRYIEEVFGDYKKYGKIKKFSGVAVEVGPGDNAGVALLMRNDGCEQVDLVDRYYSRRYPEQQKKVYEALSEKYDLLRFRLQNYWHETELRGIFWKVGQAAEVHFRNCAANKTTYKYIVSRAVMEHLYDPLNALENMINCLQSDGKILHKIDFRDHGMFTPEHPELTFLQVPDLIYPLMVRFSGRPNRILVHRYSEVLEKFKLLGLIDYELLVTRLVGVGEITPHKSFGEIDIELRNRSVSFIDQNKHRFARQFRKVSSENLSISGVFITILKLK